MLRLITQGNNLMTFIHFLGVIFECIYKLFYLNINERFLNKYSGIQQPRKQICTQALSHQT